MLRALRRYLRVFFATVLALIIVAFDLSSGRWDLVFWHSLALAAMLWLLVVPLLKAQSNTA